MYDPQTIGQRMKTYRKMRKMRQGDVAEYMEIGKSYYSMLESGKRRISIEQLMEFSRCVRVPLFIILGEDENEELLNVSEDVVEIDKELIRRILKMDVVEKSSLLNLMREGDTDKCKYPAVEARKKPRKNSKKEQA